MRTLSKSIFGLFTLMAMITFNVHAKSQVSDAQVNELLQKSGSARALESLPMQMSGISQQMLMSTGDQKAAEFMSGALDKTLDPSALISDLKSHIKNNVTAAQMNDILGWLNTDLAGKIVSAELQATDPQFQQLFLEYMAQLQSTPPSQERTQAVVAFVKNSQMVELTTNMMFSMMKNMFDGFKSLNPEKPQLGDMLDAQLEQMKTSMKPMIEQQIVMSSYFIYKDISEQELAEYGNFYQSPTGKVYIETMMGGIAEAMGNWGQALVTHIHEQVSQTQEQKS